MLLPCRQTMTTIAKLKYSKEIKKNESNNETFFFVQLQRLMSSIHHSLILNRKLNSHLIHKTHACKYYDKNPVFLLIGKSLRNEFSINQSKITTDLETGIGLKQTNYHMFITSFGRKCSFTKKTQKNKNKW